MARAAVVFSVRNNFRLRASAIADDLYDCEEDAMQFELLEHMARRRDLDHVTAKMDIAVDEGCDEESDDVSDMSSGSSTPPYHTRNARFRAVGAASHQCVEEVS